MRRILLFTTTCLTLACSGSGVSTTARTDSGGDDGSGDDLGDDGAGTSSDPADDGTPADDGGSDPSADDGGSDPSADGGSDPGDDGTDPTATGDGADDGPPAEVDLPGSWLSEGDLVAPLLVELTGAQSITAVFGDNTFTVTTIDDQGQEVVQAGVYTTTASGVGDIYDIVLEQSTPAAVTAEGIFEIDDTVSPAVLRYEIVQTEPSVGAIAPTAAGGFGSTSYGDDLTQIYLRQ